MLLVVVAVVEEEVPEVVPVDIGVELVSPSLLLHIQSSLVVVEWVIWV